MGKINNVGICKLQFPHVTFKMFQLSHSSNIKEDVEDHFSLKAQKFLIGGVC